MGPAHALCATLIFAIYWVSASAIHVVNSTYTRASRTPTPTLDGKLATTGSGSSYASQCMALSSSYWSAYTAWSSNHQSVSTLTEYFGGSTASAFTSYQDEQPRLCDGHARLSYSPAVPILTTTFNLTLPVTSTATDFLTVFSMYPGPSPTCSYPASDCDPFWEAYSTLLSSWRSTNPSGNASAPQITPPPQTPGCYNSSWYSSVSAAEAEIQGCGPCTIFGQGVELVYFPVPTTVSRDMCATTPAAKLTNYGPGAVIEAYAGTSYGANTTLPPGETIVTAVVNGHTFTSGTAYISISSVWAENRCSNTLGTPVTDAILAMPSESVLSLRYSQNHFQYFWLTNTQTGFPVSYADFNQPVPYSAWNGQASCDPLAWWECQIVYENDYRPQLAIPPQITMLNPAWEGCQLWYGGLYDPPLALTATTLVVPTAPAGYIAPAATPSQTIAATTAAKTYTAIADNAGSATNAPDASNAFVSGSSAGQAESAASAQQTGTYTGLGAGAVQAESASATTGYTALGAAPLTGASGTSESQGASDASGGLGALIYAGISGSSGSGERSGSGGNSGSNSDSGDTTGTDGGSGYNENSEPLESPGSGGTSGSGESDASGGQLASDGSSGTASGSGSGSKGSSESGGTLNSGDNSGAKASSGTSDRGSSDSSGGSYINSGNEGSLSGSDEASTATESAAAGYSNVFVVNGQTYTAVVTKNIVSVFSTIITSGATSQRLPGGLLASYGSSVLNIEGSSTLLITHQATQAGVPAVSAALPFKTTLNIAGETIVVSEYPTPTGAIAVGSTMLVMGGSATTLANGEVISHASDGLVITWFTAVALEQDGKFTDASSGTRNAQGGAATASAKLSGQVDNGLSTQGARTSANSLISQTGTTGTSRNTGSSASIQRITPTGKSAASSNAAPLGLVISALAVYFAFG